MKILKSVFMAILFIATVFLVPATAKAQAEISVGGGLVSSYIWRGSYCGSASIQPTLGLSAGGFSVTAWGSVGFSSEYVEEYDFIVGYRAGGFKVAVTDYWFNASSDYFNYKNNETAHVFEGMLGYDFGVLALAWNTFFAGNDYNSKGERAYSTYIEASVPFNIGSVEMNAEAAFTPWDGLYANDFGVVNIGLSGSKKIKLTDSFSLPIFTKIVFNPYQKQTYFVFGISL